MSEKALVALIFVAVNLVAILCMALNVRLVRRRVGRWNANSTVWFVMSLSNSLSTRADRTRAWREMYGYTIEEANRIMNYQLACVAEIIVGFLLTASLLTVCFAPG